jgi:anti-sigma regulatory factor (Ser/Thr protein kinase)
MAGEKDTMGARFDFTLTRLADEHPELLAALENFAKSRSLPAAVRYRLGLIVDEIVSNCITHGSSLGRNCGVNVTVTDGDEDIVVEIADSCPPFDPTSHTPHTCREGGNIAVGGMGLCLVRKLSAHMDYDRSEGRNRTRITLRKNIRENACNSTK